ncbi:MAG TPA: divergent polysaccharide deacetylase family protein [Stellaceae bacterium]|nr:divergent polysaccharide deacetylase family protein [Stellaceae bacterium]
MALGGPGSEGRGPTGARLLLGTVAAIILVVAGTCAWLVWIEPPPEPPKPLLTLTLPPTQAPTTPEAPIVAAQPAPPPPAPPPAASAPAPVIPPAAEPAQQATVPPAPPPPPKPAPPASASKPEALPAAPDPSLVERTALGPLPMIGPDGRKPWQTYARPFDRADKRPRIAVLLTGLGLSGAATEAAINDLPGAVTLAFNPYAPKLDEWIGYARAAGHEVFLSLAMEPVDYPRVDPGPHTLLISLDRQQNLERLQWVLSRVAGYVGVVSAAGSRFTTSQGDLLPILDEIKARGLMFVDSHSTDNSVAGPLAKSIGLPRAVSDLSLDQQQASRDAIDQRLAQLEQAARQTGVAVGLGEVYPVTIERLAQWIPTLERKGIALAPVSATADMQPDRTAAK